MTSVTSDRRYAVNASKAIKVSCKAATTANITLSGEQTIDGVSCVTNDRVLVLYQTDATENGIYDVDTGSWTRSVDFNDSKDVSEGTLIPIISGSSNAEAVYRVTNSGTIVPGTTALTFAISSFFESVRAPVDTRAQLRAVDVSILSTGAYIYVKSHTTLGDGGESDFRLVTGAAPATYTDNDGTIIVPTGGDGSAAWIAMVYDDISIAMFGGVSGAAENIYSAYVAAHTYLASIGGGTIHFPNINGGLWRSTSSLPITEDNIYINVHEGAELYTDADIALLAVGGINKSGTPDIHDRTVYTLSGTYSPGDKTFTFAAAADAGNFSAGDIVYIRTGQTLTVAGAYQPDSEWLKVKSVNVGAGTITTEWAIEKSYAQENYPAGHPDAGTPAPYGISNATSGTKIVTENIGVIGKGLIRQTDFSKPLITGNQIIGWEFGDGLKIRSKYNVQSMGKAFGRDHDLDIHILNAGTYNWPLTWDKGSTHNKYSDVEVVAEGVAQLHVHEGSIVHGQNLSITNGEDQAVYVISNQSRGRGYHDGVKIIRGPDATRAAVYYDSTCPDGLIDNLTFIGTTGVPAVITGSNSNIDVGKVNSSGDVIVTPTNKVAGGVSVWISASQFTDYAAGPARGVSGYLPTWLLDAAATEQLLTSFTIPAEWNKITFRPYFANIGGGGAGDIVVKINALTAGDGEFTGSPLDIDETKTITSAAASVVFTQLYTSELTLSAPNVPIGLRVSRIGGDAADTLANDMHFLGILIERSA